MNVAELARCNGLLRTAVSDPGLRGAVELVGMRQLLDTAAKNNGDPSYRVQVDRSHVPIALATLVTRFVD